uniref:Uncharacterized protein n=1 Tax=Tanacetum cinerariifolium TaxID=118510 RepID=A0A6L2KF23_TANCI|nr:hypothetical protein [Tanacetum cinerariifolium]
MSNALFVKITENKWEKHGEATTGKLVEASMSSLDKSSNTISDLYKGLNIITELLKEIKNVVKDDSIINKKISEATESFTKFSTNIINIQSSMNTLHAHALKQDEELSAWAKSSTNMAWNLGSRLSGLEQAQNHIQSSMSSLKEDTHSIKTMMTEMYKVFKGQSSSSVTPTLALTHIPANVKGENTTNTTTEKPPSHAEGSQAAPRIDKRKEIATESDEDPSKKLVPASTIVRHDPDEEVKVPYIINGKMCYLADKEIQRREIQAYLDREEKLRKAYLDREVIKVVQEEAEKIGLDPKKIASAKAGEMLKKRPRMLNTRLKHETITDIKIHPKTKPVVITVDRGTDGRNFDVHKPFSFGAFGIFELDELREIIPKKKNTVVQDLMNSLSRRYERIRKIPKELEIKSALPAPAPEQASSKSSKKRGNTWNFSLK